MSAKRFRLRWTGSEYKVSEPNIDTCEVVVASEYERIERQRNELLKALKETVKHCPLYTKFRDDIETLIRSIESNSPIPVSASVPEGWKLVPVEPTIEMTKAGIRAIDPTRCEREDAEQCYIAMLAAAPQVKP